MTPPASDDPTADAAAPDDESPVEIIKLSLPATGPYGRIARMSGAALALRRGLSLAAVEDLRLAIDEALILLLDRGDHTGSVDLEFGLEPNAISIELVPNFDDGPPDLDSDSIERFVELAGPLLSTFEIDSSTGTLRMIKRAS